MRDETTSSETSHPVRPNQVQPVSESPVADLQQEPSAALFDALYRAVQDAVLITGTSGKLVYMNPSAEVLTGYDRKQHSELHFQTLFPERSAAERSQTMLIRCDGHPCPVQLRQSSLNLQAQTLTLFSIRPVTDITETPLHEAHSVQLLLKHLMDHLPDNIYFKDIQSRFIMVNRAFCSHIGIEAAQVVGKTDADLFTKTHADQARNDEEQIISTGLPLVDIEEKETWADGHCTWVSTTKMPLKSPDGTVVGTFGISRDITAKKTMEQERAARKKAEKTTEAKTIFLANMSHEMRTPLSAIVGVGDLLVDTLLDAEQKDYVGTIESSSEALLDIVNSVLDLSKIEAGKLNLEAVPFNVRELIRKTMDVIKQPACSLKNTLYSEINESMPDLVRGDPVRLRQVLLNLLSNANKFTSGGSITLRVSAEQPDLQHVRLFFEVTDTGIGMEPEQIPRLFQPYEQADRSTTRNYGGTGLGLAICNKLVEQMGGQLSITSQKGIGTQIQFAILLECCANDTVIEKNAAEDQNRQHVLSRILLVEDNRVNREVIRRILKKLGYDADLAANGEEAVQAAQNQAYDLILMDVQMPVMDGLEATRIIKREHEKKNSCKPLIVGLSAHALKEHHEQAAEAGMDDYLTKPVRIRDLKQLFSRI
ncbi:ATP-binding protein [Pontiella agarivorans]|uniref:histidine kinase n=1 Tax=Pontiella agarivorans TaxID=3038953 RepID=A0ABU5MWL4_9BACT|nr:ATP-binding protein [Pontiella agarivorans]MDZ8118528.1 ATP-binding protein [Pontiella agarivorans]